MGIRLEGPPLVCPDGTDIISDGIPAGAIQVPDSGLPIILLADRQTTGGYAKPWVVISADHALLAQARPGTELRFVEISCGKARRLAGRLL
jgi:allophanate hydrolase subunit 2